MDFHWMNQWMNQWMGDVFLGILKAPKWIPALVEGREGVGPTACCKNLFPFLLKATT